MVSETYTRNTRCALCNVRHTRATNPYGGGGPEDGDATICFACGSFLIFDGSAPIGTRKPTAEELVELEDDPRLAEMLKAWRDSVGKGRRQ